MPQLSRLRCNVWTIRLCAGVLNRRSGSIKPAPTRKSERECSPCTMPEILAIITGERGQREIVRPLAAVGQPCHVLDWEVVTASDGNPYLRFLRELWDLVDAHRGAIIFTDMNSAFLAAIL